MRWRGRTGRLAGSDVGGTWSQLTGAVVKAGLTKWLRIGYSFHCGTWPVLKPRLAALLGRTWVVPVRPARGSPSSSPPPRRWTWTIPRRLAAGVSPRVARHGKRRSGRRARCDYTRLAKLRDAVR